MGVGSFRVVFLYKLVVLDSFIVIVSKLMGGGDGLGIEVSKRLSY